MDYDHGQETAHSVSRSAIYPILSRGGSRKDLFTVGKLQPPASASPHPHFPLRWVNFKPPIVGQF